MIKIENIIILKKIMNKAFGFCENLWRDFILKNRCFRPLPRNRQKHHQNVKINEGT